MKAEAEQARLELAEELSRSVHFLQELEELRFAADAESHRRVQADERAARAAAERQGLVDRLARVEQDRVSAEEMLRGEQDRVA